MGAAIAPFAAIPDLYMFPWVLFFALVLPTLIGLGSLAVAGSSLEDALTSGIFSEKLSIFGLMSGVSVELLDAFSAGVFGSIGLDRLGVAIALVVLCGKSSCKFSGLASGLSAFTCLRFSSIAQELSISAALSLASAESKESPLGKSASKSIGSRSCQYSQTNRVNKKTNPRLPQARGRLNGLSLALILRIAVGNWFGCDITFQWRDRAVFCGRQIC